MIEDNFGMSVKQPQGRKLQIFTVACLAAFLSAGYACVSVEAKNEETAAPKTAVGEKPAVEGRTGIAVEVKLEETAKDKAAVEEKATVEGVRPPASAAITKSEAQAVDRTGKEPLDDAITCLARTIYWEARNSSAAVMEAVASVVMNRLGHEGFPSTICGIVKEGQEKHACQFSWWCSRRPDSAQDEKSYAVAKEIARKALNREIKDPTNGALYFHSKGSNPHWAKDYVRTAAIGDMDFYKPGGGKAK
jgi:spore germination cell wall hydrolase CwlJ-like protein